ncbi:MULTISPECIES: alpha/beta fold hydrolase [Glycomyces]|jgi:pimeloyl-ACP methyl ester carboxylesterase|uniref:Pimeloyl-ACP methyl ester carboxylesterase n=2 Tax=Glycomyces TaxID=58113 RepID=A0ABU2ATK1_9ACTN|nr:alpha/beta hydrolase [Glycomyces lechevalierae]MDR7340536.1 pimeloyl-ACP methyl ester carboxylesterase [Glycomyces lechevalierae]
MTEPHSHTLDAFGAVLHYDVRNGPEPTLLIVGSPMGAAGFVTLAGHFADRRVVTYDPRGAERSRRTDAADENSVEEHADDLHRLIDAVGGPVDVFASSGGAVNALALVARHPEQVRMLVAHEPPASAELPDADAVIKVCVDIRDTYLSAGFGPAMAKFIALVSHQGPVTEDYLAQPAPDPAAFGLPTEDDGNRDDPLLKLNMVTCNAFEHDFDALRAAPTRIVIGVGADSGETLAARAGRAVAEKLGTDPVVFPGDHGGFLGGEYGQTGKPEEFAAVLRGVLAS